MGNVCPIPFVVPKFRATFYYTVNLILAYKKEGRTEFWNNKWNWADIMTVMLSIFALALYLLLKFVLVAKMQRRINETRGNAFVGMDEVASFNSLYQTVLSITVFT